MTDKDFILGSGIVPGSPIVLYLHSPREKLWGVLSELNVSGVYIRGIDLNTFDDWTQMIVRGERNIGLSHVFVPMWRVERVTLDESVDDLVEFVFIGLRGRLQARRQRMRLRRGRG